MGILDIFDEGKQVKDTQDSLKQFLLEATEKVPELKPYAPKIKEKVQTLHGDQLLMFLDDMVKNTPSLRPYYKQIISKFAGAGGVVESNIQPETAVVGGAFGGASGGVKGIVKGAVSALASEPILGEAFTAYENTVRNRLPDVVKIPADVAFSFIVGHFADKLTNKLPKEVVDGLKNRLAKKTVAEIGSKKTVTIDDVDKLIDGVEQEIKTAYKEAVKSGDKDKAKAIAEGLKVARTLKEEYRKNKAEFIAKGLKQVDDIKKKEWERFKEQVVSKVREKEPSKITEDITEPIDDIRPAQPTKEELREKIVSKLQKDKELWEQKVKEITQKVREKEPPKDVITNEVDDISDIKPEVDEKARVKEILEKNKSFLEPSLSKPNLLPESIKTPDLELKYKGESIYAKNKARWVDFEGKYKGADIEVSIRKTPEKQQVFVYAKRGSYPIKEELKKEGFKWDGEQWVYEGSEPPSFLKNALPEVKPPNELTPDEIREILRKNDKTELADRIIRKLGLESLKENKLEPLDKADAKKLSLNKQKALNIAKKALSNDEFLNLAYYGDDNVVNYVLGIKKNIEAPNRNIELPKLEGIKPEVQNKILRLLKELNYPEWAVKKYSEIAESLKTPLIRDRLFRSGVDIELRDFIKTLQRDAKIAKLLKKEGRGGTTLHSGIDPFKAFDAVHDVIRAIDNKVGDNKLFYSIRQLFRKYLGADKYGLGFLKEETADNIVYSLYDKARPVFASNTERGHRYVDAIRKWVGDKVSHGFIIEYLESPEFRQKVKLASQKEPELRKIAEKLDEVGNHIDALSKELYERGYITKHQYNKWKGRYLSRLYQIDEKVGLDALSRFKQAEIKSGRKIENIMALPKEKREKLGYVEDAPIAILDTIAKSAKTVGLDYWFRDLIKIPEIVDRRFVVKIPEEIRAKFPKLPEEASPYFVKNRLIKWLQAEGVDTKTLRSLAKEANSKIKLIEANKKALEREGWISLGDKDKLRYGVLSGLPVNRKFAGWLKGFMRLTDDSDGLVSAFDKTMTVWTAMFKTAKVPLNPFAVPRNFTSNIFQYYYSGANRPLTYFSKALREIATNGRYYKLAKERGLFHTNFTDEEVARVIRELHNTSKNKYLKKLTEIYQSKPAEALIKFYSAIDDTWKLARFIYALEREKKGITDAIKTAQDAHYDYSLVGVLVRAMRDPNVGIGGALKLFAPLFPTYMQKSWSQLVYSLTKRPVQTTLTLAFPYLVIHAVKKKLEEKFGKEKVEEAFKNKPEWLPEKQTLVWSNDGKRWYYIPLSYVIPQGWLVDTVDDLVHFKGGEALKDIGAFGLPTYTLYQVFANKDRFGRHIYDPADAYLASRLHPKYIGKVATSVLWYILQQTIMPGLITNLMNLQRTRHPILPRAFGFPTYEYTTQELRTFKAISKKEKLLDIRKKINRVRALRAKGKISPEEYRKEIKELIQEYRDLLREN